MEKKTERIDELKDWGSRTLLSANGNILKEIAAVAVVAQLSG